MSDARRALQGCLSPLAEAIRAACDAHHQARQAEGRRTTGGIAASIALSIASPVSLPNADEYEALRVAASAEVAAHVFALGERLGPFVRAMMGLHHLGVPVVSHLQPLAHAFSVLNVDPSHLPPAQVKEELERLEWMLADLEARLQVT